MTKEKVWTQSKLYEFIPNDNIAPAQVIELTKIIRIGVSGEKLVEASEELKKYFVEVSK